MEQSTLAQATTNDYASLLKVKAPNVEAVSVVISNSDDTNDLDYKILVSNDPEGSAESFTALVLDSDGNKEATLGETESIPYDLPLYHWYDIQVKSTTPDAASEANAWIHTR